MFTLCCRGSQMFALDHFQIEVLLLLLLFFIPLLIVNDINVIADGNPKD